MHCSVHTHLYRGLALLVLLLVGSWGVPGQPVHAAEPDTVVFALNVDQNTMDPHMHFQRVGILMNIQMYDSLLLKNPKLEYEPSLATAWQALDDTTRAAA